MEDLNANKNTVKIGFKRYAIEKPYEISETKADYYGTSNYDKAVIKIASRFEQNDKNCTFIHELIHCVCQRFALHEINNDESTVELIALGVYEAILDNPHLFKMADI